MRCAGLLVACLSLLAAPAQALEPRDLAGWWIAVDPLFPRLVESGEVVSMEELLVVDAEGSAESRLMRFAEPDATECTERKFCSNAPVAARARLGVSGQTLTVAERDETDSALDGRPAIDRAIRKLVVTATPSWAASLDADGRLLVLRSNLAATTRTLVKVDPMRLRRLRAGLMMLELSAAQHWRCLLANATAGDPAFAVIRTGQHAAPDFLDDFLKAASYGSALADAAVIPVADDPDPVQRQRAAVRLDPIMTETFPDIRLPASTAEREALRTRFEAFRARTRGEGAAVPFPISDAEFAAFVRARAGDAETRKLFCR
jgi:hypothetical protein